MCAGVCETRLTGAGRPGTCAQFGQWHPLADLGMKAWPALRDLDLRGCKDGVWECLEDVDTKDVEADPVIRTDSVYALHHWLRNAPVLESLDVSRSVGMFEARLETRKLFRALHAAPRTLSSLWMTDLGMTDALFHGLVRTSEALRMADAVSPPPRGRDYLLLPGLRFLEVSGNPLGQDALFVLAGANPATSLFMALKTVIAHDCGVHFVIPDDLFAPSDNFDDLFAADMRFGKLEAIELFPVGLVDVAMALMLNLAETTRVPSAFSAEETARQITRCVQENPVPEHFFKETATVAVVHDNQGDEVRFEIPSATARELKLATRSCRCLWGR